ERARRRDEGGKHRDRLVVEPQREPYQPPARRGAAQAGAEHRIGRRVAGERRTGRAFPAGGLEREELVDPRLDPVGPALPAEGHRAELAEAAEAAVEILAFAR